MIHIIAFLCGSLSLPLFPVRTWPLLATAWLSGLALMALVVFLRGFPEASDRLRLQTLAPVRQVLIFSVWSGLGGALAAFGVDRLVDAQLPDEWQGRDIQIQGRVIEVVEQSASFNRFFFEVMHVETDGPAPALRGQKLRLAWYYGPSVKNGEHWQLEVRLKRPRGFINPRGFDYGAWLLSQGVVATGYAKEGSRLQRSQFSYHPAQALSDSRELLKQRLFQSQLEYSAFFQALLLGDKTDITGEQWRVLQRTGTIHLMAISGLHVGLVAVIGYGLGWVLIRIHMLRLRSAPSPPNTLWQSRLLPPLCSCVLATVYAALAGFSIPTQRALVVVLLSNVVLMLGRRPEPLHLLAIAGVLVVVGSPLAPTQAGFWLSFGAVLVLITGFAWRPTQVAKWRLVRPLINMVKAQVLLAAGLLAPILALGASLSVVGCLANLVAVPVVSLLVVPGLLTAAALAAVTPAIAAMLVSVLDGLFGVLWQFLTLMSQPAWAQWWPSVPVTTAMVAAIGLASLFVLAPRGVKLRSLGAMVLGFAVVAPRASAPQLQVVAMEVGQGTAVVLKMPGYVLVYDTGPRFSADFDAGSRILLPYLQGQGVHSLDRLVVSHGDNDHAGGVAGLLRDMPTAELMVSPDQATSFGSAEVCEAGQRWRHREASFTVLWPPAGAVSSNTNDSSCVILVEWRDQRVLLAGDIEAGVERQLLAAGVLPRDLTLLIAPHHGSKTSSITSFVQHVNPAAVIFSAGYRNRYGHPHPLVVERYQAVGAQMYNTGQDGAITATWQDAVSSMQVSRARRQIGRAWH